MRMRSLVDTVLDAERRLRCAYLRSPAAELAALDTGVQTAYHLVRRAAATPLYLRQQVALWRGSCDGVPLAVLTWGKRRNRRRLCSLLFDEPPVANWLGARPISSVLWLRGGFTADADVLIAETTPTLAPAFRWRGFSIVPEVVRFGTAVGPLAIGGRKHRSRRKEMNRLRRQAFRAEIRRHAPALTREFHQRFLLPTAIARFGADATCDALEAIEQLAAAGCFIVVSRAERSEPDAMGLVVRHGATLSLLRVGVRDGRADLRQLGALAAIDAFAREYALRQGVRWLDEGRGNPWLKDSRATYKMKWGCQPTLDLGQTQELAIKFVRAHKTAASRLFENQVVVRQGSRLSTWPADRPQSV